MSLVPSSLSVPPFFGVAAAGCRGRRRRRRARPARARRRPRRRSAGAVRRGDHPCGAGADVEGTIAEPCALLLGRCADSPRCEESKSRSCIPVSPEPRRGAFGGADRPANGRWAHLCTDGVSRYTHVPLHVKYTYVPKGFLVYEWPARRLRSGGDTPDGRGNATRRGRHRCSRGLPRRGRRRRRARLRDGRRGHGPEPRGAQARARHLPRRGRFATRDHGALRRSDDRRYRRARRTRGGGRRGGRLRDRSALLPARRARAARAPRGRRAGLRAAAVLHLRVHRAQRLSGPARRDRAARRARPEPRRPEGLGGSLGALRAVPDRRARHLRRPRVADRSRPGRRCHRRDLGSGVGVPRARRGGRARAHARGDRARRGSARDASSASRCRRRSRRSAPCAGSRSGATCARRCARSTTPSEAELESVVRGLLEAVPA